MLFFLSFIANNYIEVVIFINKNNKKSYSKEIKTLYTTTNYK